MMKFKVFFLLICLQIFFQFGYASISSRIIAGSPAKLGSAPFHVSLRNLTNYHLCGGAILSKNVILTAAHCFYYNPSTENVIAVMGTYNINEMGDRYRLKDIVLHEGYSSVSKENDIAIVTPTTDIIFTNRVRPLPIHKRYISAGPTVVIGYGETTQGGDIPTDLMTLELKILNWTICKGAYGNVLKREIFPSQLCTYNGFNEGTCRGDSGSPLTVDNALVGITSFGVPCAIGMPDVFTRVSDFIPWIHKTTEALNIY